MKTINEYYKKFQSPKSGKFESNQKVIQSDLNMKSNRFNPLNRGNLNQILDEEINEKGDADYGFNPLNRGNLNQMRCLCQKDRRERQTGFNPLNRGNLNQMRYYGLCRKLCI